MRRISARLAAPAAALALLLAAGCTSGATQGQAGSQSSAGAEKEQLTLAFETDVYGWDPSNQPGYQNWQAEAVWDQLVLCDANGKLTPNLADTFEITNQNRTFKGHIREGVKFSDGTPVDSAAVAASFDFVTKNGGAGRAHHGIKAATPAAHKTP